MKIKREVFDELQKLNYAMLNNKGKEMFNPMPMEASTILSKPETLEDRIAKLIKGQLSAQAAEQEYETIDEADDFDLEDDFVVELSGYELADDEIPIMPPAEPDIDPDPNQADPPNPQPKNDNPEPDRDPDPVPDEPKS